MGNPILTPDCPRCGGAPQFDFIQPFFCPNRDCPVVSWEPTQSPEQLAEPAAWHKVDLSQPCCGNTEEHPPRGDHPGPTT